MRFCLRNKGESLLDVCARAESFGPVPGEDACTDGGIVVDSAAVCFQLAHEIRREEIEAMAPVYGQAGGMILYDKIYFHDTSLALLIGPRPAAAQVRKFQNERHRCLLQVYGTEGKKGNTYLLSAS